MKFYVKPAVDVVKLSVKETIADLPVATGGTMQEYYDYNNNKMYETVYELTKASTSAPKNA